MTLSRHIDRPFSGSLDRQIGESAVAVVHWQGKFAWMHRICGIRKVKAIFVASIIRSGI